MQQSLSTHREEWATFLTERQSFAKGLLEEMEDIKAKTKGVAGDTTSTVLARSFGDYAQRDFFAGVAALVLGLALVVGTLVVLIIDISGVAPSQSLSWSWSLMKLGLVSTASTRTRQRSGCGVSHDPQGPKQPHPDCCSGDDRA